MAQLITMAGTTYYFTEADDKIIRVSYTYMHNLEFPGDNNLIIITGAHHITNYKKRDEYFPHEYTGYRRRVWQSEILQLLRPDK